MNRKVIGFALGAVGLITLVGFVLFLTVFKEPTDSSENQTALELSAACAEATALTLESDDLMEETFKELNQGILDSCGSYQEFVLAFDQVTEPKQVAAMNGPKFLAGAMCLQAGIGISDVPLCTGLWNLPGAPTDDQIRDSLTLSSEAEQNPFMEADDLMNKVSDQLGLPASELEETSQLVLQWLFDEIDTQE